MRHEHGFSLLEVVFATALMLAVTGAVFAMLHPAQGAFAVEPERSDMQQRLRVAADALWRDLMMAGSGAYRGPHAGSLLYYLPPVLPFRQGVINDDPPGTFAADRITLLSVPATTAQATLAAPLTGATPIFSVRAQTGCPLDPSTGSAAPLCGFEKDQTVLVFDTTGNYALFTITAVSGGTGTLAARAPARRATSTFPAGSKIVEAESHAYYLRTDAGAGAHQLMHYDGSGNADVPVADNIVGLRFDYYGEGQPPMVRGAVDEPASPATTYGPKPSAPGEATCIFSDGSPPAPLLPALGDGSEALVALTASQLTDGPFCPSDAHENRWDADLLRIRRISVTLRVQAAMAALRGPAGVLFAYGGASRGGPRWLPDQEIHFDVSPRNLNLGR